MKTIVTVLYEHLPLVIIVALYIAAGFCVQFGFQIEKMMNVRLSYNLLNIFSIYFSLFFLVAQIVRKKLPTYFIPKNVWGFILVIALAPPFMSTFSSFKQVIPIINNFSWDYEFMKMDYILHFGHHPWEIFKQEFQS